MGPKINRRFEIGNNVHKTILNVFFLKAIFYVSGEFL